ncbi:hypothetical protein [Labrys neptuniae]
MLDMNYRPDAACFNAAKEASGGKLTDDEIMQAFQKVADEKERLTARGETTNLADRLQQKAEAEAQRAQIAAAMNKRIEAINILTFDKLLEVSDKMKAGGMKPHTVLQSLMRGTESPVEGSRVSVDANTLSFRGMFLGDMFGQIQRERPEVIPMLRHREFDNDVVREMMELREGGTPGITKNTDAQYIAKVYATYAEMSRVQLNKLGASIGKLDGWAGAQTHDDQLLMRAGKVKWVDDITKLLDVERTFPEAQSMAEVRDVLDDVYDTIVTGISAKPIERQSAGRVNPANLAKSLGKERVLHFKDADAVIAYRDAYGYGNTSSSIMAHQSKASKLAAAMEMFGPNPENMVIKLADRLARDIRDDPKMDAAQKQKLIHKLRTDGGALRTDLDIMSGLASRPVDANMAAVSNNIRAGQSMAKLGGATISSAPADLVTTAIASQFRGSGFWKGLTESLGGVLQGRPKGEQQEITYLLNEGFEGIIGHINADATANDTPMGRMSVYMEKFFKINGMTWWDGIMRGTSVRTIAAEMGMRASKEFTKLPKAYQHVLSQGGIDEARWNVIRQAEARLSNGRSYILGDSMRNLSDEAVSPLIKGAIRDANEARFDLEMKVRAFVADQSRYGMISTDARSRAFVTQGLRPGTIAGEAIRFMAQFKGFPVAFTQRVLGRAIYGQRADANIWEKGAHIGTIIAGLGAAGYMAMTAKDALKGNWPPRDPSDPKTMLAAFQQGGALGIYGDYLFAQNNRFGGGPLETAAGPTIGTIADIVKAGLVTRDYAQGKLEGGKAASPAAQWVSLLQGNTPYANLFYVKPALDYLIMNNVRDWATPGATARAARQRFKDYGQTTWGQR